MFKVRALKRFNGDREGHVDRGCTFETTRERAYELAGLGVVEVLEGSEEKNPAGKGAESTSGTSNAPPSSSLPVNPSRTKGSSSSEGGPSSQSATQSTAGRKPGTSTRPTSAGGKSTTKKSARSAKPTDGARTAKRLGTLTSDTSNPSAPPASLATPDVSAPASSATAVPKVST